MSNGDHHNVIQTRKMSNKQAIGKESSSIKKGPLARYVNRLRDRYAEKFLRPVLVPLLPVSVQGKVRVQTRSSFKDPWARLEAKKYYTPRMTLFTVFPGIGLGFVAFLALCACEHVYYKFKPPEEDDDYTH